MDIGLLGLGAGLGAGLTIVGGGFGIGRLAAAAVEEWRASLRPPATSAAA
jgi:F0F1-type ATP synthase membrane subunit c/vacuolar-type H+-ATPase subunit K